MTPPARNFKYGKGDFNVDSRTIDYFVSIVDIFQSIVFTRSPLAAPIGDSWKLDPRWDAFNHLKTLSVIVLYSECLEC